MFSSNTKIDEALHVHMNSGNGVVISFCNKLSSGCHAFGKSLHNHYSKLNRIVVVEDEGSIVDYHVDHETSEEKESSKKSCVQMVRWESAILTGCSAIEYEYNNLLRGLQHLDFRFMEIKNIFVVTMPHSQAIFPETLPDKRLITATDNMTGHYLTVLTAGLSETHKPPYSIGIPNPLLDSSTTESNQPLKKNCFGLMYNTFDFSPDNGEQYLHAYFSHVSMAATQCQRYVVTSPSVLVITGRRSNQDKSRLEKAAKKHNISVEFTARLKQADYFKSMSQLKERGGVFSSDGEQSILEAASIGTSFFVYYHQAINPANGFFYEALLRNLPRDLQKTGAFIVGLSGEYNIIKLNNVNTKVCKPGEYKCIDAKDFQAIQISFQATINRAIKVFDTVKQQSSSLPKTASSTEQLCFDDLKDYCSVPLVSVQSTLFARRYQDQLSTAKNTKDLVKITFYRGFAIAGFKRSWLQNTISAEPNKIAELEEGLEIKSGVLKKHCSTMI